MLQLIFMDAGQGDSTLIIHPDGSLVLVDCGSLKNKNIVHTQIEQVLTRALSSTNNHLKALVLTHPDPDHYNLVQQLIMDKGVTLGTLYYGGQAEDYGKLEDALRGPHRIRFWDWWGSLEVEENLSYDGTRSGTASVDVRILSVNAGNREEKDDSNPNSMVLMITYKDVNIFLMGDSTVYTENIIAGNLGAGLDQLINGRRSVLKVGHHGSNTSSSLAWLQRIRPQVAFISSDTRSFNGSSIPTSTITQRIMNLNTLRDFPGAPHFYVQYNEGTTEHENVPTTRALYTTLHLLQFDQNHIGFKAHGTSWYYAVHDNGDVTIIPACGWDHVNTG